MAELSPVLLAYPAIGVPERVVWQSPRPFAASGLVACSRRVVFVKRHDYRVRSPEDVREEHAFMAHLRQGGVAVPAVLAARDGDTAPATRMATYEVHEVLPHVDIYRDAVSWSPLRGLAHARGAGRALAELHRAAAGFNAPPRRTGLLVGDFRAFGSADPMGWLARRVAAEPALRAGLAGRPWQADIAAILLPLHAALRPHLGALPPLWTHNDFHASNVLWNGPGDDAEVAAVLDFGLCNRTTAMFDLATAIERNTVEWLRLNGGAADIAHSHLARALIEAYRAARPISRAEARALPFVLPLVHAEFALSELAYFHAITHCAGDADAAYHDFLLGHARWFATPQGRAFQDDLADAVA